VSGTIAADEVARTGELVRRIVANVERAVEVRPEVLERLLVAVLAEGHVLIEDLPGVGKTTLARALARSVDLQYARIQCTADLLPADVVGTNVFNQRESRFEFRPGPIFANVVLVDEINRASPRTQAALLEPMEERQATVDGATHQLPEPFFLVATQNPFGSAGTFPLPESQLDRFALVCTLGLPGRAAEREILDGEGGIEALDALAPVTSPAELSATIEAVHAVHCAHTVRDYVLDVADATRSHPGIVIGASPRASLGLLRAAQAHATVMGRDFVSPDDVKQVAPASLAHRLVLAHGIDVHAGWLAVGEIVGSVESPRP
jgi:MoxR-like ATPase